MQLLFTLLLLDVVAQPTALANRPMNACDRPGEGDLRPYTLCLAETWFDRTELELERQLNITLAGVEAERGASAAHRLKGEQQEWARRRNSECEVLAAPSPSTQVARNDLACRAQRTEERIAHLKLLAGTE
jgi:uncharacterized protein YecT (DUF1311 family)